MKDMMGMMRQARDMQKKMEDAQAQLDAVEALGRSGGGAVEIAVTGKGEVKRVTIAPELFNEDDKAVLEDLIAAAMNDARAKAEAEAQKVMSEAMGPLAGMGGLFGG